MRPDSFRFSPPRFDLPQEAQWTLLAAFSPTGLASAEHLDMERVLEWIHLLTLGERIASRHEPEALVAAVGPVTRDALIARLRRTAARSLLLIELARLIADSAERLETPIVLLKGVALLVSEITALGSRDVCDVDALVPRSKAQRLAADLVAQGMKQAVVHESSQHLPALIHPQMGVTEIHVSLRELHVDSNADASFEELQSRDLLTPASDPANSLLPSPNLLAAHALAHGIAQHGHSPQGYPFLRVLADLQDLASPASDLGGVLASAQPFIRRTVSERELEAVRALDQHLRQGVVPADGDGAALIRHAVAAHLAPEYGRSLKVDAFWSAVKRRDWTKISHRIKHSLARDVRAPGRATQSTDRRGVMHGAVGMIKVGWAWLKRSL